MRKQFSFVLLLFLCGIGIIACQRYQNTTSTPVIPVTTSTATPFDVLLSSPTPVPSQIDFSDAIPLTPDFSLEGIIIDNKGYINPVTWEAQSFSIPYLERFSDISSRGISLIFDRENFFFSNSGKRLAFPCLEKTGNEIKLCILDASYLQTQDAENLAQYLKKTDFHLYSGWMSLQIRNISWSPDDKYLIVTIRWSDNVESPCFVEVNTAKVDCSANNLFRSGFTEAEQKVLQGAYAIAWSPVDKNKLVFPLRKNWSPFFDKDQDFPFFLPTGNYEDGLYLIDLSKKNIEDIWVAPINTRMDYEQLPLWSAKGERITFIYQEGGEKAPTEGSHHGGGGLLVLQNYVVASIDVTGENFTHLFDGKYVYSQIAGSMPPEFRGGQFQIRLGGYSPDEKYILFEVDAGKKDPVHSQNIGTDNYILGLFLYEIETREIYQVKDFELYDYDFENLMPNWGY
jgi:hypothetical protein